MFQRATTRILPPATLPSCEAKGGRWPGKGFTLIELLLVIGAGDCASKGQADGVLE
jgi:type II secretory pathway pseudopilin PulG